MNTTHRDVRRRKNKLEDNTSSIRIGLIYMGSAWVPALQVAQGSTSTCSIQYSIESENRYRTTHSLRV